MDGCCSPDLSTSGVFGPQAESRLGLGTSVAAACRTGICWSHTKTFPSALCRGQVLTGRQQQIQEKIEQNRREQEESLRHREQLIQNLEEARESARREKEESKELKSARKQELEAQVGTVPGAAWGEGCGSGPCLAPAPSWHRVQGP